MRHLGNKNVVDKSFIEDLHKLMIIYFQILYHGTAKILDISHERLGIAIKNFKIPKNLSQMRETREKYQLYEENLVTSTC